MTASAKDKQYECCRGNGHVKVKMPSLKKKKKKWLKFHDDPYVFNISFMLYADFALIIIIRGWAVQKKDESNEEWAKW